MRNDPLSIIALRDRVSRVLDKRALRARLSSSPLFRRFRRVAAPATTLGTTATYAGCVATAVWGCSRTAILLMATLVFTSHITRIAGDLIRPLTSEPPKYARSAMTADDIERVLRKLDALTVESAVHRDPNLTLARLSTRLGVATNDISQALNCRRGGFHEWLARARVNDVQQVLAAAPDEANLLEAAYAAGFNSKSTFYEAFRRVTGQAPSAWRAALARRPEPQFQA